MTSSAINSGIVPKLRDRFGSGGEDEHIDAAARICNSSGHRDHYYHNDEEEETIICSLQYIHGALPPHIGIVVDLINDGGEGISCDNADERTKDSIPKPNCIVFSSEPRTIDGCM